MKGLQVVYNSLAILKLNGDDLLNARDDGAFLAILKNFFTTLDAPIHPNARNEKARRVTVSLLIVIDEYYLLANNLFSIIEIQ